MSAERRTTRSDRRRGLCIRTLSKGSLLCDAGRRELVPVVGADLAKGLEEGLHGAGMSSERAGVTSNTTSIG
eukprot:11973190-Alexandrium_andersonii.AAC.1